MEDGRHSTPLVIKRADLYRQVWSTPLVQLAARYKTTTADLANMCAQLNVPRPPSGYWLKKSTGKPVAQALPPADTETVLEATLTKLSPEQTEFENRLSI